MTAYGWHAMPEERSAYWECNDGCGAGADQGSPTARAMEHTGETGHITQVIAFTRQAFIPDPETARQAGRGK